MDKELQQLEAELKGLRPRMPSTELHQRVEQQLTGKHRSNLSWFWTAMPLAAALALAFLVQSRPVPMAETPEPGVQTPVGAVFKPVAVENLLYAAHDDGIVTLADGRQARQVRKDYVDTVLWRNPQTNASLTWTVPRQEVSVVPVSFQ